MAKDEAKIKFSAETSEFTSAIKQANSSLAALRSAMKMNEAEFKASGNQAEYLTSKHKLLEAELDANKQKQENLNSKLEKAISIFGESSNEAQKWSSQLTKAKAEQLNLETALNECNAQIEAQAEAEKEAQSPLGQLTTKISEQEAKLEDLKTQYKNVVLEQGSESDAARGLAGEINSLSGELSENRSRLEAVETAAKEAGEATEEAGDNAQSSADGGWSSLKQIISDLATETIQECISALKELAKETVQLGIDFTSSMSNVEALSGATAEELGQLEMTARELGASTVFSASEVADAFSYMALAGWDTEDMLSGVEGVLNLAAAANMDLASASDIVTDYLTAFGLSAEEAGYFVDEMAYAMANSNTDVEQLGEAYKNCAATAGSMGYSVEETTAALMTLANAGVKGGEAGTSLSSIMTRLATDTKGCATELEKYGVHVYDAEGNMNSLSSIVEGCCGVWGDLTDEEQANLAKTIAGTSQYSEFVTLMEQMEQATDGDTEAFSDYTAQLEEVKAASEAGASAAADMAETMQDNLGGDLKELNSAWEEFQLKIFGCFEEPLRNAVQFITNTVIPALTEIGSAVSPVLETLSPMAPLFEGIAVAAGIFAGAMAIQAICQLAAAGLNAVKSSMQKLNVTMSANPILLVISLIAGLVTAFVSLYNSNEEFRNAVDSAWETIKTTVSGVIEAVIGFFNGLVEDVQNAWDTMKTTVSESIDAIVGFFTELVNKIQNVWDSVTNAVSDAWDNIVKAVDIGIQLVASVLEAAFLILTLPFQFIWVNFGEQITEAWEGFTAIISEAIEGIAFVIESIWSSISETASNVWNAISTYVSGVLGEIASFIGAVWSAISEITFSIWSTISTRISDAWNAISTRVSEALNTIQSIISSVWSAITTFTSSAWNSIQTAISDRINAAKTVITTVVNGIKTTVTSVFNALKSSITSIFTGIQSAMTTPIEKAKTKIKSIVDTVKGFFNFTFSWPSIKLPHFSISPAGWTVGDLLKGSIPSLGISWYAKGAIFDEPTLFATSAGLKGVGEAGPEAVAPVDVLMGYFDDAINSFVGKIQAESGELIDYDRLAEAVSNLTLAVDGNRFAKLEGPYITNHQNKTTKIKNLIAGVRT